MLRVINEYGATDWLFVGWHLRALVTDQYQLMAYLLIIRKVNEYWMLSIHSEVSIVLINSCFIFSGGEAMFKSMLV